MPRKQMPAAELAAKKELALEVIERLKAEYPDAACTLDYADAWQLLVSVPPGAQCTDARVNVVVEDLFAQYPGVAALAAAEPEEIEAIVKPCGLGALQGAGHLGLHAHPAGQIQLPGAHHL